jgi:hypothetical protein
MYGIFQCAYNIFQCIYSMFQCIIMCLNVFIDIVIGISPSHSHCNVFAMHIHLHIFIALNIMIHFPTCYITTLFFFHFHWFIPAFIQSMKNLHINPYTSKHHSAFHVPHSTFHIVIGCAEHSEAQDFFPRYPNSSFILIQY